MLRGPLRTTPIATTRAAAATAAIAGVYGPNVLSHPRRSCGSAETARITSTPREAGGSTLMLERT